MAALAAGAAVLRAVLQALQSSSATTAAPAAGPRVAELAEGHCNTHCCQWRRMMLQQWQRWRRELRCCKRCCSRSSATTAAPEPEACASRRCPCAAAHGDALQAAPRSAFLPCFRLMHAGRSQARYNTFRPLFGRIYEPRNAQQASHGRRLSCYLMCRWISVVKVPATRGNELPFSLWRALTTRSQSSERFKQESVLIGCPPKPGRLFFSDARGRSGQVLASSAALPSHFRWG